MNDVEKILVQIQKHEKEIKVINSKIRNCVDKVFTTAFGVQYDEEFTIDGTTAKLKKLDGTIFAKSRLLLRKNKNGTWRKTGDIVKLDDVINCMH